MTEHAQDSSEARLKGRTDAILRGVIIVLVSAIIGAAALFGYTIWQARNEEGSATPAQRALGTYAAGVRKSPNDAALRVRYGEALAAAGLEKDAIEQFRAAIKVDKNHTGAYYDLGMLAMQSGDRKSAEGYFLKVIELTENTQYETINQRREQSFFQLGTIALDDRRYEESAGYFKAALRIRKDASDTYYMLAQAFRGLDDGNAALKQLDAALAFDPNFAEAHFLYGQILFDRKDYVNAAIHLRKAADLAPMRKEPAEALAKLGTAGDAIKKAEAALDAKRYPAAIEDVLLARAIDPKNVDAIVLHARILVAQKNVKAAKAVVKEALAIDPKNAAALAIQASLGK